ncbi:SRPBCC family protein [Rhodococcus koreensis]|uniref:Carbon monoxide dehydrogenase subunit G n=1 Tax=Rhodococcus koreensis TaxID=99653 RepID=A0A1H5F0A4_9NOCA|nr:SRPBCC family protein [Rhodococcus koreensis]SED96781.1 Carbon monoxide dehydrogenase subunit G [Rhodococcus koreensis]
MQLENTFTVAAPLDAVWAALKDPEMVAPCFPGATLTEYTGDSFTGVVKVKLGPISMNYNGKGTYIERDDDNYRVVIDASGRDSRGNGSASAKVTGTMKAVSSDKTEVTMVTDMNITGRPAQFGRGMISEVADRMIGQFADRLAARLAGPDASSDGSVTHLSTATQSNDEAINLLGTAGGPVLKALVPAAGLVAVLVLLLAVLRRSPRSN